MPPLPSRCALLTCVVLLPIGTASAEPRTAPRVLKDEIERTHRELTSVRERASAVQQTLVECQREAQRMRKTLAELKAKDTATLADLAEALVGTDRNLSELEKSDGRLRDENAKLASELKMAWERAKKEAASGRKQVAELEQEKAKLAARLQAASERAKMDDTTRELVAGLEKENAKLAAELKAAWERAKKEDPVRKLVAQLEKENARLDAELEAARQRAKKEDPGQKLVARLENENAALAKHLKDAAAETDARLAEQRILQKRELETHRRAAEESRAETAKLRDSIAPLKDKVDEAQAKAEQRLTEQRVSMKREIERHLAAAEASKRERDHAASELKTLTAKLDKAIAMPAADPKLAAVAAERDLLKTDLERLSAILKAAEAAHLKGKEKLAAEQLVRADLEQQVSSLKTELAAKTMVKPARPVALAVVRFDKNADATRLDRETLLGKVTAILAARPDAQFDIVGHTCNTGRDIANANLSRRRAESVRDMLVEGGIPAEKLQTRGVGQSEPLADNGTLAGRRLNRRVEVHLRKK